MLLDMAGRRPILMLCTILLVLIKCTDTQNDQNGTQPSSGDTNNTPKDPNGPTPSSGDTNNTPKDPNGPTPTSGDTNNTPKDNQSSPLASTTATLTPTPVTRSNSTAPSQSPPGCGYKIKKIPFGFEILTGASGSYTIEYQDDQSRSTNVMFNGSSHKIMKLCYYYTAIKVSDGTSSCSLTGDSIFSYNDSGLLKIEFNSSIRKVCHNAIWNPSGISFKVNNVYVKGSCRRIEQTEFCSNVTATITSAECQFSKTETIEIIPALKDIQPSQNGTWPVKITEAGQFQCIKVNYICNGTVPFEGLKLFQKYSCIGKVLYKNKTIPSPNTTDLTIDTNCDVKISLTKETITNTSAHFKWNVHSRKCPKLLNEPEYEKKCEYVCEYKATDENEHRSVYNKSSECALTKLMPFTNYNFVLKLECYGKDVKGSELKWTHVTEPGNVKESGTHMTKMEVEQFCLANNPSTR